MLIKLFTEKKGVILKTNSPIPLIKLRNCLEDNKMYKKLLEEKILDYIVKELKYFGWEVICEYNNMKNNNHKYDLSYQLFSNGYELYFKDNNGYLVRLWNKV